MWNPFLTPYMYNSFDYFPYLNALCQQKLVAYLKYMTTVGVLLGGKENETRHQMREVLELEIKLAQVSLPFDQQ